MNDSISRAAAIKQAEKESQVDGAYGYMDTKSIVDMLNDLPSIQPKRKKAFLVNPNPYGECSECAYVIDVREGFNFCPNCGADMRGEK